MIDYFFQIYFCSKFCFPYGISTLTTNVFPYEHISALALQGLWQNIAPR